MPHGQLHFLGVEVIAERQRRRTGRKVLLAIREMHLLPRLTALNDDAAPRGFWYRVGRVRHESNGGISRRGLPTPNGRWSSPAKHDWTGPGSVSEPVASAQAQASIASSNVGAANRLARTSLNAQPRPAVCRTAVSRIES